MHDLTAHNYDFIVILFVVTFFLHVLDAFTETVNNRYNIPVWLLFIFTILGCLSKVFNIGLGIAVGIEFFMLAHGG